MARRNEEMMGRRAYGWTADDQHLVEHEAAELRRITRSLDPLLPNPKSLKQIVRELNDRHVPTSEGNEWEVTPLRRMLINPRMIGRKRDSRGRLVNQGELIYPPIMVTEADQDVWRRVRKELTDPRRRQGRENPDDVDLLTEFITCGLCQARLGANLPKHRRPRYACHVSLSSPVASSGCGRMSIQMETADDYVQHEVVTRAGLTIPGETEVSVAAWWARADLKARRELIGHMLTTVRVLPAGPGRSGTGRLEIVWKDAPGADGDATGWPDGLASAA